MTDYPCGISIVQTEQRAEDVLRGQCSATFFGAGMQCEHRVEVVLRVISRTSEMDPRPSIMTVSICACPLCAAAGVETIRRYLEKGRRDYATSEPAR